MHSADHATRLPSHTLQGGEAARSWGRTRGICAQLGGSAACTEGGRGPRWGLNTFLCWVSTNASSQQTTGLTGPSGTAWHNGLELADSNCSCRRPIPGGHAEQLWLGVCSRVDRKEGVSIMFRASGVLFHSLCRFALPSCPACLPTCLPALPAAEPPCHPAAAQRCAACT